MSKKFGKEEACENQLVMHPVSNSCVFFYRKHKKHILGVFLIFRDFDEPKSRITDAIDLITVDMFERVYEEFNYGLDVYFANNGSL